MTGRLDSHTIDMLAQRVTAKPKRAVSSSKKTDKMRAIIEQAERHDFGDTSNLGCIRDVAEFRSYIDRIIENGICSIDTETTGLNPMSDEIVGVCLYTPRQKAVYVPMRHTDFDGNPIAHQIAIEDVAEGLSRLTDVRIIFHNAKFDIRFIRQGLGVRLVPHFDTSLAGNYLNENEPHKLKYLHARYVQRTDVSSSFSDIFDDIKFSLVPIETAYLYASGDALKTFELYEFQSPYLDPEREECRSKGLVDAGRFYHETEIPLIPILADMEDRGFLLDVEMARRLSGEYTERIEQVKSKCLDFISRLDLSNLDEVKRSKLSDPVNLSSPVQMSILIYDVMGLKPVEKQSERGTGAEVLEAYAEHSRFGHFFKSMLKYRELTKLLSTYIDKLPTVVNERTGAIHASFNQYGAKTGRFSSSDPNLQNIPASDKSIRQMFTARPDCVLISCDYSQQEPRVLAHVADDSGMIEAYATGKDLYSWIASGVYQVPYEECREVRPDGSKNPEGKKRRDAMKVIVLGIMYGMGVNKVADSLSISIQEARSVMDTFFDAFPSVKQYIDSTKSMAHRLGYVQTVWGRKRRLPEIQLPEYQFEKVDGGLLGSEHSAYFERLMRQCRFNEKEQMKSKILSDYGVRVIDNGGKIAEAQRQSVNSVIQGTSADITKRAMLAIGTDSLLQMLDAHMIVTVHDEIIVECPDDVWTHVGNRMMSLMIEVAQDVIKVPMKVDCEVTRRWSGDPIK